jgi:UDP-GlcNAc3NAcA epimerase
MILTVVGARPQFVKAAVVSNALNEAGIPEDIIHTGQHYDARMSDVFWEELGLPVIKHNLMVGSGSHAVQTAEMMVKIEAYLKENPGIYDAVMVYGDTNSTIASALVAAKMNIKLIHIESGLRSFNRTMPEEVNRIVTDRLADILFCSSKHSVDQLFSEGITTHVHDCGDVMQDAVLAFCPAALRLDKFGFKKLSEDKGYSLLTLHRPSNVDDLEILKKIFGLLEQVDENLIWPLHPRLKSKLAGLPIPRNISIVEPLSYFEMLAALNFSRKVLTDSGGLQKEAYWMKKPCITLRGETEWVETQHDQWNILVKDYEDHRGFKEIYSLRVTQDTWYPLYGDGSASRKIAAVLKTYFK